jgi:hypothetical protein
MPPMINPNLAFPIKKIKQRTILFHVASLVAKNSKKDAI